MPISSHKSLIKYFRAANTNSSKLTICCKVFSGPYRFLSYSSTSPQPCILQRKQTQEKKKVDCLGGKVLFVPKYLYSKQKDKITGKNGTHSKLEKPILLYILLWCAEVSPSIYVLYPSSNTLKMFGGLFWVGFFLLGCLLGCFFFFSFQCFLVLPRIL